MAGAGGAGWAVGRSESAGWPAAGGGVGEASEVEVRFAAVAAIAVALCADGTAVGRGAAIVQRRGFGCGCGRKGCAPTSDSNGLREIRDTHLESGVGPGVGGGWSADGVGEVRYLVCGDR